jgi:hypothetical protein
MRKFLWVAAVGALVLTLAAPAMALDFKFGAEYRVRFTETMNGASPATLFSSTAANNNYRAWQLRVRPRFDVSDDNGNMAATLRLEIGDVEFGNGGGASAETNGVALSGGGARVGNGGGGGFGADGVNVETKWAYVDFSLPFGIPMRVRAGLQPWFTPKGIVVDDDVAGIRGYGNYGIVGYELAWFRPNAGPNRNAAAPAGTVATAVTTSPFLDNNLDVYGAALNFAFAKWLNIGVYDYWANNRVNCTGEPGAAGSATALGSSAPCANRVRNGNWLGFTATGDAGIVSYDADFVWGTANGGPTGAFGGAATPVKVSGFAADLAVHIPIGPVKLNVMGAWGSGDERDGGLSEAFPSMAASWNGPGGGFEIIGSGGAFDQVEYTQDGLVNIWSLGASVEYVPVKVLWLRLGYAFAGFSNNVGNCAGAPAGTCFGPAYPTIAGKSTLGHELHLRADYTLWTGFKLQGLAGYLIPTSGSVAQEYVFQMLYNF